MRTVLLLLLCLPAPLLSAQGVPASGFSVSVPAVSPGTPTLVPLAGFDRLPGGALLLLSGHEAVLVEPGGMRVVFAFPPGTWGAFVRSTASGLFLAESTVGSLQRFDPDTGDSRLVVRVGFPFDLAEGPGGELYLSANPGFGLPSSGNRIYLLDPVRGSLDEIVRLPGPSGPVAVDASGALYCAEQSGTFPTPMGAVRVLRWSAAQVRGARGPGYLTERDASVVWTGLDGAFGLALDRFGRIYASDPQRGGVLRFDPVDRSVERLLGRAPATATGHAAIRIDEGPGPATLDPYQPEGAGSILVAASDYMTFARVERLAPARPGLAASPGPDLFPGRNVRFEIEGAPAGGVVVLLMSGQVLAREGALFLGGRSPLFLGLGLGTLGPLALLGTDQAGRAELRAHYPGGGPMDLYLQALLAGGPAGLRGSSSPLWVRLH